MHVAHKQWQRAQRPSENATGVSSTAETQAGDWRSEQSRDRSEQSRTAAVNTRLHWFRKTQTLIIPVGIRSMSSLTEESEDRAQRSAHGTNTPIYFWNKVHGAPPNSASWGKKRKRSKPEVVHPAFWIILQMWKIMRDWTRLVVLLNHSVLLWEFLLICWLHWTPPMLMTITWFETIKW